MAHTKRKLVIFLADLTHTGMRIATENFPLNIGLLATYAMKRFGTDIEVRLFKYPEALHAALQHERCDVLGCSTYVWNNNLSEWACRTAKGLNPDVVTVRGGWNFPLLAEQQHAYMRKHRLTDVFCRNEGEVSFSSLIERLLSTAAWKETPIAGAVFLDQSGRCVRGEDLPRIKRLDDIPSPYTSGLMDAFFDGRLTPIIETARGCPFSCNYCNNSHAYYNQVRFFSVEYVEEEIRYIAERISRTEIRNLLIADTNFGMYERDTRIARTLAATQRTHLWPLGIGTSTAKNNLKRLVEITDILGNALTVSMSVQSMNPETLKAIHRENIDIGVYHKISSALAAKGGSQIAEVIVPLPEETFDSYMKGVRKLLDMGAQRLISYTLQLNHGTVYKDDDFRRQFGYKGQFRLIPYDFGTYGGQKVFDYEEVATSSASLSFDEYLRIRRLALVTELLFNNSIFQEAFRLLAEKGLDTWDFLMFVFERLDTATQSVREVVDSFIRETRDELKESEEALVSFYEDDTNYERLCLGEIGGNVLFRHKGLMLGTRVTDWVEYVFTCLSSGLLDARRMETDAGTLPEEIASLKVFATSRLEGLFSPGRDSQDIFLSSAYDIPAWLADASRSPLENFRTNGATVTYRFYYDEAQRYERDDLFRRYGKDNPGIARILARVPTLERLFRKVEHVPG